MPLVRAFEGQNPEVRVEVLVDNSSVLESRLLSGELDAALLDAAGRSGEIQLRPFLREELSVAAAPFYPLAQCPAPVTARQLAECDFIMREEGSMPRLRLAAFLGQYGLTLRIKWSCTNLHTVVQAVKAGMGVSVLSPVLMREELAAGTLAEIPVEGFGQKPGDLGGSAPGPERLCAPGAFSGLLSGTVRPVLSPDFIRIKTNNAKKPRADPGFFVCCHETDVLGKNPLKTHCVSPINLL